MTRISSLIKATTRKLVANTRSRKEIQTLVLLPDEAPGEFIENSGVITIKMRKAVTHLKMFSEL